MSLHNFHTVLHTFPMVLMRICLTINTFSTYPASRGPSIFLDKSAELCQPFSFPEPTIWLVSGGIVGLWYQPLPDVVNFTTSGSGCLIRQGAIAPALFSSGSQLPPARGLDPWRRPKRSWALGTRMELGTALGMTTLTTTEKFEFLSIESWC